VHFGIVADTQLPWCGEAGKPKDDVECAVRENIEMVAALNKVSNTLTWAVGVNERVRSLAGVFINGDLTAFGHFWQVDLYRRLWETHSDGSPTNNLKLPIWPGLGNHDYANNVGDCTFWSKNIYWMGYGQDSCAQRMLAYARAAVAGCDGHTISPSFGGRVDHYDESSAAYTVSFGKLRAVVLHNYPTYAATEAQVSPGRSLEGIGTSMAFLKKEIDLAEATGAYLLLVIHDIGDHLPEKSTSAEFVEFEALVTGTRVLGIFAGHYHSFGGHHRNLASAKATNAQVRNKWGDKIPVIRSFAPDQRKFMVLDYNEDICQWRFGTVDASGGTPKWFSGDSKYHNTFTLKDCTPQNEDAGGPVCKIGDCSSACPACGIMEQCDSNRCVQWSEWTSEESGETMAQSIAVSGIGCSGRYCDKVRMRFEISHQVGLIADWSAWASDDTSNQVSSCPAKHVAVQIGCKGKFCDEVRLRCASYPKLNPGDVWQSGWFSEEDAGQAVCPADYLLTAVECHARKCIIGFNCKHYCDDKKLHCTKTTEYAMAGNELAAASAKAKADNGAKMLGIASSATFFRPGLLVAAVTAVQLAAAL